MSNPIERERAAMLVISWLVGLQDERPRDAAEQWPMILQADANRDAVADALRQIDEIRDRIARAA